MGIKEMASIGEVGRERIGWGEWRMGVLGSGEWFLTAAVPGILFEPIGDRAVRQHQ
jgi:hypothetical protein